MNKATGVALVMISAMLVFAIGLAAFGVSREVSKSDGNKLAQVQAPVRIQAQELAVATGYLDPAARSRICHEGGFIGPCQEEALTVSEQCHWGGQNGPCLSEAITASETASVR